MEFRNSEKYQILLIKYRKYGYGSSQFYKGLSPKQINLINDLTKEISIREAKIFLIQRVIKILLCGETINKPSQKVRVGLH